LSIKRISIALSIFFIAMFASVKLRATTSSLTGSCAAMMTLKPLNEIYMGLYVDATVGDMHDSKSGFVDAMVVINFTESKIYVNGTKATVSADYNPSNSRYETTFSYATETVAPISLTITDGPLPGSFVLAAPPNTIPDLILMPVNSSNTFLIQAKNGKATGLCQKV
jgi:hypothetical protein